MDVTAIIADLRQEHEQLTEAIAAIERLGSSGKRRRGRPPAWLTAAKQEPAKRRGRPPGSKNKPNGE